MIDFIDQKGDAYTVHRDGKRISVTRGPSVVLSGVLFDDRLVIITSHPTAPSKLAVLRALGLVQTLKPAEPVDVPPEPVKASERPVAPRRKHKPLSVKVEDDE